MVSADSAEIRSLDIVQVIVDFIIIFIVMRTDT